MAHNSRHASLTMSRYVLAVASHTAYTTLLYFSKTHRIHYMALHCACGRGRMRSVQRLSAIYGEKPKPITMNLRTRHTGSHTASAFSPGIHCTIYWEITYVACGSIGTKLPTSSTPRRSQGYSASQHRG